MLCKIFARGRGKASGIDYLLGPVGCRKDGSLPKLGECDYEQFLRNPPAKVLRGSIDVTKKLIAGLPFRQRYTSGCLSFSEKPEDISNEIRENVMDSFESMIKTGFDDDRLTVFWVQHEEKGRVELHFVVPNVDLGTGKRFPTYFDRVDRPRFEAWQNLTNAIFGFSDPTDPALKRVFTLPADLPSDKKEQQRQVGHFFTEMIGTGKIKNRDQLMEVLIGGGYKVTRKGSEYISIEDRKGQKLRLRGPIYSETFISPESLEVPIKGFEGDSQEEQDRRTREKREEYERESAKRRRYIESRFQRKGRKFRGHDINPSSENESLALLDDFDRGDIYFWDDDNARKIYSLPTMGDRDQGDVVSRWKPLSDDYFPRVDLLPTGSEWANLPMQKGVEENDGDREYVTRCIGKALERIRRSRSEIGSTLDRIGAGIAWVRNTIRWVERASQYFRAANQRFGRSLLERALRRKEKIELSMRVQKITLDHESLKPRLIKENYKNNPGM